MGASRQAIWNCEKNDARFIHALIHGYLLRPCVSLRQGLPETEVDSMHADLITVIALILSVLLLGYLALTLLFPEKF
jgi:K+-transporting ATPase KdpF subunit